MALPSISNKKRAVVIVGVIALVFVFLVGKLVSLMFVQGQWLGKSRRQLDKGFVCER